MMGASLAKFMSLRVSYQFRYSLTSSYMAAWVHLPLRTTPMTEASRNNSGKLESFAGTRLDSQYIKSLFASVKVRGFMIAVQVCHLTSA